MPRCAVLPLDEPIRLATRGLSMTIHGWVTNVAEMPVTRSNTSCRALVARAEQLALADPDESLHISALCRALEVSERTLRKAFHSTRGAAPCRHLRMLRLSRARRALLSADGDRATVTEIASCFGFGELGRFSVEYRKVFGESPSQTLSRAPPADCPAFMRPADHQDRLGA
jgi:transcriptional regulator GlxA family with amidase domain